MALLVSIHAPREGCDEYANHIYLLAETVSIHAPREGCDPTIIRFLGSLGGFNSRTPGGVRLSTPRISRSVISFNSRTPGGVRRRETQKN